MHLDSPVSGSSHKDKVTGFNVKILDDKTFVLDIIHNDNYSKNKTYSYETFEELVSDLRKDFGKKKKENTEKKIDNLIGKY